ncbi:MAG: RNA ligase family protein [Planctomycetota bacterium]
MTRSHRGHPVRPIQKYPRTQHIEGSRLQLGDEDLPCIPLRALDGLHLVVEEKLDGANAAFSFAEDATPWLQSRGHYLTGGPRERHFDLFKAWVRAHAAALFARLGARYIVYGEWLFARHTIFYDALPHYFMEFDVLDAEAGRFLSTPERRALLEGLPLRSVPVVAEGTPRELGDLASHVGPSLYRTPGWRARLAAHAAERGLDVERLLRQGDPTDLAEGLYIKVEGAGGVERRLKFVRASFLQAVDASDSHWLDRPILPNALAEGVDLFGGVA